MRPAKLLLAAGLILLGLWATLMVVFLLGSLACQAPRRCVPMLAPIQGPDLVILIGAIAFTGLGWARLRHERDSKRNEPSNSG